MHGVLQYQGAEIVYRVHGGSGATPVLLIRPLGGSMRLWGSFEEEVAKHHSVVVFDHAGTGLSHGQARLSIGAMASDVLALQESLACKRVHLFGLSLGGMIALKVASVAASRTASLCLAATPLVGWRTALQSMWFAPRMAHCLFLPQHKVEVCLLRSMMEAAARGSRPPWLSVAEQHLRPSPSIRSALLRHGLAAVLYSGVRDLARVGAPSLVMVGTLDPFVRVNESQKMAARLPKGRCVVLEGAGHDLTLERPRETATHLLEFLKRLGD